MKKIIALLLLLTVSLSLFGCKVRKYRCAWDGFCYAFNGNPVSGRKKLESGGSGYILDILNSGTWEVGTFDCDYDFEFTAVDVVYYHSLCGTFYDVTNGIILKVTEEQRLKINSFLKDSDSARYVWEGFYYDAESDIPIEFKPGGSEYIADLLNNCAWENGIPDFHPGCDPDHYFLTPRQKIYYHSECGTLYDRENGKVSKLTEEQRLMVNSFFDNGMEYILDLLLNSTWKKEQQDSHSGCDSVYYLSLEPKLQISYHSECGTFYNMETGSTFKATEEQRLKINSFLENGEYEDKLRRNLQ